MEEVIIPVVLFLTAGASVFGLRYMTNKERMAMIEKGLDPVIAKTPYRFNSLKIGLLLIGVGVGLFIAYTLDHTVFAEAKKLDYKANQPIYLSLIAVFGGLGLFISHLIEKKDKA